MLRDLAIRIPRVASYTLSQGHQWDWRRNDLNRMLRPFHSGNVRCRRNGGLCVPFLPLFGCQRWSPCLMVRNAVQPKPSNSRTSWRNSPTPLLVLEQKSGVEGKLRQFLVFLFIFLTFTNVAYAQNWNRECEFPKKQKQKNNNNLGVYFCCF